MSNIKFYSPVDVDDTSSGLTVAGDLTVDTNVLHVDTTNNRVGIGTTSPTAKLTVSDTYTTRFTGNDILFDRAGPAYINATNASGKLGLQTGGNTRMYINESGNIGIGTSSPSQKLHVSGGHLQLDDTYKLQWGGTNARIDGSNASDYLRFFTSDTERIRIDTSGNVGIGTTAPGSPLHIASSGLDTSAGAVGVHLGVHSSTYAGIEMVASGGADGWIDFSNTNSANDFNERIRAGSGLFQFYTSGSEKMRITNGGNVLIGTTTDSGAKLNVQVTGASTTNVIKFGDATPGYLASGSTGVYLSDSSGTARLMFKHTGEVGIGTSSPATFLHSNNGSVSPNSFRIENSDGYGQITTDSNVLTYDAEQHLFNNRARSSEYMRINASGNVGIGTTSIYGKMHVSDSATGAAGMTVHNNLEASGNSAAIWFKVAGSTSDYRKGALLFVNDGTGYGRGDFYFASNTSTGSTSIASTSDAKMVIKGATGNVGIGTTSPSYNLEVNGSFSATTLYGDGSNLTGITATETDTLDSVTGRGSSTANSITVGGLTASGTGQFGSYATIGTSIAGGFMMDANNGAFRANGASGNKGFYFQRYNNAGTHMFIGLEGTYLGRVGIGTTTPASTFMVHSTGTTAVSKQWQTIISDNNTLAADRGGGIIFRGRYLNSSPANFCGIRAGKLNSTNGDANAYLSLLYGAAGTMTEGVRINYNGNTLIGTTTDSGYKLAVNGDVNADGDYYSNGTQGYTGTITINQPSPNPPINIDVQGGIITNVY